MTHAALLVMEDLKFSIFEEVNLQLPQVRAGGINTVKGSLVGGLLIAFPFFDPVATRVYM